MRGRLQVDERGGFRVVDLSPRRPRGRKLVLMSRSTVVGRAVPPSPDGHDVEIVAVERDTKPGAPNAGVLFVRVRHVADCVKCRIDEKRDAALARARRVSGAWAERGPHYYPAEAAPAVIHAVARWVRDGGEEPSAESLESARAWMARIDRVYAEEPRALIAAREAASTRLAEAATALMAALRAGGFVDAHSPWANAVPRGLDVGARRTVVRSRVYDVVLVTQEVRRSSWAHWEGDDYRGPGDDGWRGGSSLVWAEVDSRGLGEEDIPPAARPAWEVWVTADAAYRRIRDEANAAEEAWQRRLEAAIQGTVAA